MDAAESAGRGVHGGAGTLFWDGSGRVRGGVLARGVHLKKLCLVTMHGRVDA